MKLVIKSGLLKQSTISDHAISLGNRIVIITDDNVAKLYATPLLNQLKDKGVECDLISIKPGEQSKSRHVKAELEDKMFALGCGRDTVMIAVGGGVVTDLTGYIASTFCRGVPVIYVPTTLLAMVDAAIGGKTGINTEYGKNLLGTITQPVAVYSDPDVLHTLPDDELLNGLAETIKHGLIGSLSLFEMCRKCHPPACPVDSNLLLCHPPACPEGPDSRSESLYSLGEGQGEGFIKQSTQVKLDIIENDLNETQGARQLCNYGHTVAHAIERVLNYTVPHGQAVSVGLWIESWLSNQLAGLSNEAFDQLKQALSNLNYSIPVTLTTKQIPALINAMRLDKKAVNQSIKCCLLDAIGKPHIKDGQYSFIIEPELMEQGITAWIKEHS